MQKPAKTFDKGYPARDDEKAPDKQHGYGVPAAPPVVFVWVVNCHLFHGNLLPNRDKLGDAKLVFREYLF